MAARQEPSTAMLPFCVKHASAQPCSRAGEGELPNGRAFQVDIGGPPWSHSAMYMYNCSAFLKCAETSRTRPADCGRGNRYSLRQALSETPRSSSAAPGTILVDAKAAVETRFLASHYCSP
ncbi:hypothetical protein BT67DRAFT_40481 [Trichocladium antarcticum]|uniref:Uncharacterized protein n=1 Tax=Trichocladium antarcticum TaxID=1450529 RepID=A0AAN6ZC73_9PEZI|nr:hypothetical protein BT67DRAFT_40481 [Trichocladium antarcticum]